MTNPLERCTLVLLDGADLQRAAQDPGLAAMVAEGRQLLTHFTTDAGDGGPQKLGMIFTPPKAPGDHATVIAIGNVHAELEAIRAMLPEVFALIRMGAWALLAVGVAVIVLLAIVVLRGAA